MGKFLFVLLIYLGYVCLISLHASLRGGTTWESPNYRAAHFIRDCQAPLNEVEEHKKAGHKPAYRNK